MRMQAAVGLCSNANDGDKSKWGTKVAMTAMHVVFVGALFALDVQLIGETLTHPWYTTLYLLLFILSLFQYFYTSSSPPGYVLEVLNRNNGEESGIKRGIDSTSSSASSKETHLTLSIDPPGYGTTTYGTDRGKGPAQGERHGGAISSPIDVPGNKTIIYGSARGKGQAQFTVKEEMISSASHTSRSSNCAYCHCWQPPRSKHCHDCEKCVLRFDHHCVWLGTCIGQGNHCKFWWYLFEDSMLCIWTAAMYIMSICRDVSKEWWRGGLEIILLIALLFCLIILLMLLLFHTYLILTNQTTYELIRKRRIHYLRSIPDRVHPFSKGILRNVYNFCCSWDDFYTIDSMPTREELEEKARPYSCWDILSCRCC
ncbi:protein S-acyltransferase 10 isoform X1 [Cryptomeria japonica]|uniref:protein S-acyltransferase 10 isoform X1 n=1 Tax=Cryptomeria japonica TaxID=3369 RepID=UPI0025ACB0B3|nr:protein S-acyltransferase 10 isoform X1 [Cryptomeria japonica]